MFPRKFFNIFQSIYRRGNFRQFASGILTGVDDPDPYTGQARKPTYKRNRVIDYKARDKKCFNVFDDDITIDEEKPPMIKFIEDIVVETETSDRFLSIKECSSLRKKLLDAKSQLFNADDPQSLKQILLSLDANILQTFFAQERLKSGLSYTKFLLSKNLFNPGCVSAATRLIREYFMRSDAKSKDEKLIDDTAIGIYEKLSKDFPPVLKQSLMLGAMTGLACSSRWKDAMEWMKSISSNISVQDYKMIGSPLIAKAFDAGQPSIGFEAMRKLLAATHAFEIDDYVHEALWKHLGSIADEKAKMLGVVNEFVDAVADAGMFGSCLPVHLAGEVEKVFSR